MVGLTNSWALSGGHEHESCENELLETEVTPLKSNATHASSSKSGFDAVSVFDTKLEAENYVADLDGMSFI